MTDLSDLAKTTGSSSAINNMLNADGMRAVRNLTKTKDDRLTQLYRSPISKTTGNPAEWTYERLGEYINDFEAELDDEHEIGARLVSFGQAITFHIEKIGYYGPDIISFDGINENGEKVQLIQNISQLSVLLVSMKKLDDKPRRIGFKIDEE